MDWCLAWVRPLRPAVVADRSDAAFGHVDDAAGSPPAGVDVGTGHTDDDNWRRRVSEADLYDVPALRGSRDMTLAVQALLLQRLPLVGTARLDEFEDVETFVDLMEDRFGALAQGLHLVEITPHPWTDCLVLLAVPSRCAEAFTWQRRGCIPEYWAHFFDSELTYQEVEFATGHSWEPDSTVLVSGNDWPLTPERSCRVTPGCLVRVIPPGKRDYHLPTLRDREHLTDVEVPGRGASTAKVCCQ